MGFPSALPPDQEHEGVVWSVGGDRPGRLPFPPGPLAPNSVEPLPWAGNTALPGGPCAPQDCGAAGRGGLLSPRKATFVLFPNRCCSLRALQTLLLLRRRWGAMPSSAIVLAAPQSLPPAWSRLSSGSGAPSYRPLELQLLQSPVLLRTAFPVLRRLKVLEGHRGGLAE